ncbi:MAG: hypothetical protein ACXW2A_17010 [Burkholderiales bacterium]
MNHWSVEILNWPPAPAGRRTLRAASSIDSSVFMLLWGITAVSLVWMCWTEIVPLRAERAAAPHAVAQPA